MREKVSSPKDFNLSFCVPVFHQSSHDILLCYLLQQSDLKAARVNIYVRRGGPNYLKGLANMRALSEETGVTIEVHSLFILWQILKIVFQVRYLLMIFLASSCILLPFSNLHVLWDLVLIYLIHVSMYGKIRFHFLVLLQLGYAGIITIGLKSFFSQVSSLIMVHLLSGWFRCMGKRQVWLVFASKLLIISVQGIDIVFS